MVVVVLVLVVGGDQAGQFADVLCHRTDRHRTAVYQALEPLS